MHCFNINGVSLEQRSLPFRPRVMFMDLNLTVPNFVYNPLYNSIDLTPERAPENCWELAQPRILDILILQDKTLFGALEASNIVC